MNHKEIAISVDQLHKTYKLFNRSIDRIKETFSPFGCTYHTPFHAISNISFDIYRGETVGIVGRNGCGKSTLLQLVCGILQPTSGTVKINGRVSALLELGAGFNPEFTGRQNVYLNGSILGLTNKQIDDHLDDILAFADIGSFIDQPVKSYSSGMYVRLAFAVAISIKPDILVVDEALSVGDEAFQRKCFAHINQIQENGGTILFVSHSATTIIELCNRALLFDKGEMLLAGSPKQIVSRYQKMLYASPAMIEEMKKKWLERVDRFQMNDPGSKQLFLQNDTENSEDPLQEDENFDPGLIPVSTVIYESNGAKITNPHIRNEQGQSVNILKGGQQYFYQYTVNFERNASNVLFGMMIKTMKGFEITGCSAPITGLPNNLIQNGTVLTVRFPFTCSLNPGIYFLNAGIIAEIDEGVTFLDRRLDVAMFRVRDKKLPFSTAVVDLVSPPQVVTHDSAVSL
ncbi:MAG: ABC transporter ATP-binding protein [Desulfobulbaceae bacterium]|nr:ABC transporter ATP-binding protein [Desulfobulbaceae bacterium]